MGREMGVLGVGDSGGTVHGDLIGDNCPRFLISLQ